MKSHRHYRALAPIIIYWLLPVMNRLDYLIGMLPDETDLKMCMYRETLAFITIEKREKT